MQQVQPGLKEHRESACEDDRGKIWLHGNLGQAISPTGSNT